MQPGTCRQVTNGHGTALQALEVQHHTDLHQAFVLLTKLCNKALLLVKLSLVALLHLAPQHVCSLYFLQHQEMIVDTSNKMLLLLGQQYCRFWSCAIGMRQSFE